MSFPLRTWVNRTWLILLVFIPMLLTALPARAALPPLSPKEREAASRLTIVGVADTVTVTSKGEGGFVNWNVDIEATVQSVEKGAPADIAEKIRIHCWQARSPRIGAQGHQQIPAQGAAFRMWLTKNDQGTWEPLRPNGIELLGGHAALDMENPSAVSTPAKPPAPTPQEAYQTKSGTRFARLGDQWSAQDAKGRVKRFAEVRRDFTSIILRGVDSADEVRLPRVQGKLQIMDANGAWRKAGDVVRTIPPVTPEDATPEIFRVAPSASAAPSNAPPLPPDPNSAEVSLAFVRHGNTWEQLNTNFNSVDARYAEQYRDKDLIQLQLIIENEYQTPHTLTLLRTKDGARVVLPDGGGFRRVQLVRVPGDARE